MDDEGHLRGRFNKLNKRRAFHEIRVSALITNESK